ncbi:unnamed protein product [Linum trigynum]|uniref:Defensin-like protein n=1 Tax=Linum trigynum TaxID=586398 RepID=A0AAV2EDM6_9ROSI
MKSSSSSTILALLLLLCLLHGNKAAASPRTDETKYGVQYCNFGSFRASFLHLRYGVCEDSVCDTACNIKFGEPGILIRGQCERRYCVCSMQCYFPAPPPPPANPDPELN